MVSSGCNWHKVMMVTMRLATSWRVAVGPQGRGHEDPILVDMPVLGQFSRQNRFRVIALAGHELARSRCRPGGSRLKNIGQLRFAIQKCRRHHSKKFLRPRRDLPIQTWADCSLHRRANHGPPVPGSMDTNRSLPDLKLNQLGLQLVKRGRFFARQPFPRFGSSDQPLIKITQAFVGVCDLLHNGLAKGSETSSASSILMSAA